MPNKEEGKKKGENKKVWLDGYYDPKLINNWKEFQDCWSMGAHAEPDWVWFGGDYFSHEQVKKLLQDKKYVEDHLCGDDCKR